MKVNKKNKRIKPESFKATRIKNLKYWLKESNRKRNKNENDQIFNSLECKWHELMPEHVHCNFFCGIAEWSSNITDVLTDKSCDNLSFSNQYHHPRLYRQYIRLMFIISELCQDFGNTLRLMNSKTNKANRTLMCEEFDKFNCFVNKAIKHKIPMFHKVNAHLPIYFVDDYEFNKLENHNKSISISSIDKNPEFIIIPKLQKLIDLVITSYKNFDTFLRESDDPKHLEILMSKFSVNLNELENED